MEIELTPEGLPVLTEKTRTELLKEIPNPLISLKYIERVRKENPDIHENLFLGLVNHYPQFSDELMSELGLCYESLARELELRQSSLKLPRVTSWTIHEIFEEFLSGQDNFKKHSDEVKRENPVYVRNLEERMGFWKTNEYPESFYYSLAHQGILMYKTLKLQGKKDKK